MLDKTIFCFGKMYAKGSPMTLGPTVNGSTERKPHEICPWPFCQGGGWTNASVREAALTIKHRYPEMPGMCMYGEAGVVADNDGDTPEQLAFEQYTAQLMLDLYPG